MSHLISLFGDRLLGLMLSSSAVSKALQFLNSRPWRFPYIGWTEEDWFWDKQKQKCVEKQLFGRRWEREPLAGLSAPNAYLALIHLCGANLRRANLREVRLSHANLQKANLRRANLQKASLWDANLQKARLSRANLQEANLLSANLQKARLSRANLQKASLWYANLQETRLGYANLQEADLSGANLEEANLLGANLEEADLSGDNRYLLYGNLQEANLVSANLQEADLSGANLTPKQIKSACFWDKAIYKGEWDRDKQTKTMVPKNEQAEQDNTKFIEDLKKDKSSDPKEKPDCSHWLSGRHN